MFTSSVIARRFTRISLVAALALTAPACYGDGSTSGDDGQSTAGTVVDPPKVPVDVCGAIAAFPGWGKVAPVPEHDAQGRDTVWYVAIPITDSHQYDNIAAAGIQPRFTDSISIITGQTTPEGYIDPATGVVQKAVCVSPKLAEVEWALVAGSTFNRLAKAAASESAPPFEAIVVLPVPPDIADAGITYQGMDPLSAFVVEQIGF